MPSLKLVSAKKLIRKLESVGFTQTHQRGSHLYMKNSKGNIVTIPVHGNKDIPIGTLHNIVIKQAKLSAEEFNSL